MQVLPAEEDKSSFHLVIQQVVRKFMSNQEGQMLFASSKFVG